MERFKLGGNCYTTVLARSGRPGPHGILMVPMLPGRQGLAPFMTKFLPCGHPAVCSSIPHLEAKLGWRLYL